MRLKWATEEVRALRIAYPWLSNKVIGRYLKRPDYSVQNKAVKLGLKKAPEYMARAPGCFRKGHRSWNTGTHYVAGGRSAETRFKRGVRQGVAVKLYKPVGTERVCKDGYLQRKVNDGMPLQKRWRAVHLIVWESVHGPLPKGHAVCFKNADKRDFRIENLELVPRAELMARNTYHRYPQPIPKLIQLRGALNRQINKRAA
jgi:hypothetical protein